MVDSDRPKRCVALISGGLDSILAIRTMQEQGVEVESLNFKTLFTCCQDMSAQAARDLDVQLTVIGQEEDYLDLVRNPRFGRGRGANPCVDCRIYMFEKAKQFMRQVGAGFIISGEVVGQRPMSQKRTDLQTIGRESGLEDLLLRPLSAKLLPPTLPEREGWVDREKLHGFSGRGRKELIRLARHLGIQHIPTPSTGCSLTEVQFSKKVFDLIRNEPTKGRWDYELLSIGRHFRFDKQTKVVVGRHESDNERLLNAHRLADAGSSAVLLPRGFPGPAVMIIGPLADDNLAFASGLISRYGKPDQADPARAELIRRDATSQWIDVCPLEAAEKVKTLASV